jgi:hypothetical protein
MVYMFLAITAPAAGGGSGMGGMGGMSTLSVPTLAFVFVLILVGYTIWDLDQLSGLRHGVAVMAAGAAGPVLAGVPAGSGGAGHGGTAGRGRSGPMAVLDSPGTVVGCRIAMGVTMALMLIIMI